MAPNKKLCPNCNLYMIKRLSNFTYSVVPPITPAYWWCGNCEHTEEAESHRGETEDQRAKARWKAANDTID